MRLIDVKETRTRFNHIPDDQIPDDHISRKEVIRLIESYAGTDQIAEKVLSIKSANDYQHTKDNTNVLFKGVREDNMEWIEGALLPTDDRQYFIATSVCASSPVDETAMCVTYKVKPETIYIFFQGNWQRLMLSGDNDGI